MTRPRILVAATLGRADLLAMFGQLAERAELTFVEYAGTPGVEPERYEPYGRLTTWEEHRSARSLLDAVEPDLLAMLAIGSRNQLALRCEARRRGLRVVHVEHGYRLPRKIQLAFSLDRSTPANGAGTQATGSSLATHRFFAASLPRLPLADAVHLARYALPSVGGASHEAQDAVVDLRRPDRYVSFSPECFAFHGDFDRVPPEVAERTVYTGVPQFDCFRSDREAEPDSGDVVLVDHQLHNSGVLGWDERFHREWAESIHAAVVAAGRRLVVKSHPGDRTSAWTEYDDGSVEIVPSIELLERRARSARVTLGIMSTLQLPLAGLGWMASIAVEVHPRQGVVLSSRMTEAGVSLPVSSFEELRAALAGVPALHERQRAAKPAFVERFLHRLDGRAEERLTAALLAEAGAGVAAGAGAAGAG
jgi:hypothetical protein